jgi:hypothetical protein
MGLLMIKKMEEKHMYIYKLPDANVVVEIRPNLQTIFCREFGTLHSFNYQLPSCCSLASISIRFSKVPLKFSDSSNCLQILFFHKLFQSQKKAIFGEQQKLFTKGDHVLTSVCISGGRFPQHSDGALMRRASDSCTNADCGRKVDSSPFWFCSSRSSDRFIPGLVSDTAFEWVLCTIHHDAKLIKTPHCQQRLLPLPLLCPGLQEEHAVPHLAVLDHRHVPTDSPGAPPGVPFDAAEAAAGDREGVALPR